MEVIDHGIDHITMSIFLQPKAPILVESYDEVHKDLITYFKLENKGVAGARYSGEMEYRPHGTKTSFTLNLFSYLTRRLRKPTAEDYCDYIHDCLTSAHKGLESKFSVEYKINKIEYYLDWQGGEIKPFKKTIKQVKPSTIKLAYPRWEDEGPPSTYYAKANGWELVRYNKTKQLIDGKKLFYYPLDYADAENPVFRTELRLLKDYINRHDLSRLRTENIALKLLGNIKDTQKDLKLLAKSINPKGTLMPTSRPLRKRSLTQIADTIYERIENEVVNLKSLHDAAGVPFDPADAFSRFRRMTSTTHSEKNKMRNYKRQLLA